MNQIVTCATAALMLASLTACTNPYDPVQRGAGGALLGAASGAAIGGAVGGGHGAGVGAAIGGVTGLLGGLATTPQSFGYTPRPYSSSLYPAQPYYGSQSYSPRPYGYGGGNGYDPGYTYRNRQPTCITPSCGYPGSYSSQYSYSYPGYSSYGYGYPGGAWR